MYLTIYTTRLYIYTLYVYINLGIKWTVLNEFIQHKFPYHLCLLLVSNCYLNEKLFTLIEFNGNIKIEKNNYLLLKLI